MGNCCAESPEPSPYRDAKSDMAEERVFRNSWATMQHLRRFQNWPSACFCNRNGFLQIKDKMRRSRHTISVANRAQRCVPPSCWPNYFLAQSLPKLLKRMNQTEPTIDTAGNSKPPFLVRKRTTFTWIIPIPFLLAATLYVCATMTLARLDTSQVLLLCCCARKIVRLGGRIYLKGLGNRIRWALCICKKPSLLWIAAIIHWIRISIRIWGLWRCGHGRVLPPVSSRHISRKKLFSKQFGQPYLDYFNRVPRLLPSVTPNWAREPIW